MKLVQALSAIFGLAAANAYAQIPTVVVGEAATAQGDINAVVVEQPENAANPLGDPIIEQNEEPQMQATSADVTDKEQKLKQVDAPAVPAKNPGDDFQNTLLEANGRIYDVQSYPQADLPKIEDSANPQTIYSPNVNP